jgi:hypothetical protein
VKKLNDNPKPVEESNMSQLKPKRALTDEERFQRYWDRLKMMPWGRVLDRTKKSA